MKIIESAEKMNLKKLKKLRNIFQKAENNQI